MQWGACGVFFLRAEDGIGDGGRSRGFGEVYKGREYSGICGSEHQQGVGQG